MGVAAHLKQQICRNCIRQIISVQDDESNDTNYELSRDSSAINQSISELNNSIADITSPIKPDVVVKLPLNRGAENVSSKSQPHCKLLNAMGIEICKQQNSDEYGDLISSIITKIKSSKMDHRISKVFA